MAKLVFARHGESEWNKANLFTGWADVDLSEKGVQQAIDAGKLIKKAGIEFDVAFTSVLKRAIKTTNLALEFSDQLWVPVQKSWRLNERHYGGLTGKNKAEAAEKFGEEQVHIWRRSYDTLPPEMPRDDEYSAHNDRRYALLDSATPVWHKLVSLLQQSAQATTAKNRLSRWSCPTEILPQQALPKAAAVPPSPPGEAKEAY